MPAYSYSDGYLLNAVRAKEFDKRAREQGEVPRRGGEGGEGGRRGAGRW
jgi:hypothetical protein